MSAEIVQTSGAFFFAYLGEADEREAKCLFINRVGKASKQDSMDIPKGRHLPTDADPASAALRELREESGLVSDNLVVLGSLGKGEVYHSDKEPEINKTIEYFVIALDSDEAPLLFDLRRANVDGTHGITFYSLDDIEKRPNAFFKHEAEMKKFARLGFAKYAEHRASKQ